MRLFKPIPAAALLALGAFTCWVGCDIFMKFSREGLTLDQQVLFNRTTAILIYLVASLQGRGLRELKTKKHVFHIARGVINCINLATVYYAVSYLPLANYYTLAFTVPLMIALLSVFVLNERPRAGIWMAIATGFIGVVIAVRPDQYDAQAWPPGPTISMFVASLCFAVYSLTIKWGGNTESRTSLTFYPDMMVWIVFLCLVIVRRESPQNYASVGFALLSGLLSGTANLLLTAAYRRAMNAVVAPMHYSQIITGSLAGYMIWGDIPTWHLAVGATIIIASGYYVMRHERQPSPATA